MCVSISMDMKRPRAMKYGFSRTGPCAKTIFSKFIYFSLNYCLSVNFMIFDASTALAPERPITQFPFTHHQDQSLFSAINFIRNSYNILMIFDKCLKKIPSLFGNRISGIQKHRSTCIQTNKKKSLESQDWFLTNLTPVTNAILKYIDSMQSLMVFSYNRQ